MTFMQPDVSEELLIVGRLGAVVWRKDGAMGSRGQNRGLLGFDDPWWVIHLVENYTSDKEAVNYGCASSSIMYWLSAGDGDSCQGQCSLLLRIGFQSLAECSLCALLEQLVAHLFVYYCAQEHIVLDGAAAGVHYITRVMGELLTMLSAMSEWATAKPTTYKHNLSKDP